MVSVNMWLAGFFACAAVHYSIHWWGSRRERALLVFSTQCAAYTGYYLAISSYFGAQTVPECQAALDRFVTFGVLIHTVYLHLYAYLGARRDHVYRALATGVLLLLLVIHQWAPLRGTVLELRTVQLPGGASGLAPIRSPAGAPLAVFYITVLLNNCYGIFVARRIWRRDHVGAVLVVGATTAVMIGTGLGFLIDFVGLKAPYVGAWPHAAFVVCMTIFLSREYSARGARVEQLVATRTRELEEAKEDAVRANQAKSQFLAHISHEIRTPLHVMLSHAQLLDRDGGLGQGQRAKIGIIGSSGRHLQTLIDDLLEMSKLEAGRPELVEAAFDPWATLVEVERMFSAEAAAKGVALTAEQSAVMPPRLLGDGGKVKQILINLASNALKFTPRGSIHLQASARPLADESVQVEIAVRDTGIGISPHEAAQIFQPFEQLEAGKHAGGAGLGLAISLAHAKLMGGHLGVESTAGVGSTFKLTYVARRVTADDVLVSQSGTPLERAHTVRKALIVDDLALNRDLLAELLSGSGFETRTAGDGAGALAVHAEWHPDLVLIDLRMHGMGGVEAIQRMRDAKSRAAIGALSASVLDEDERLARAHGADFFMRKPYDYAELLDQITRVLATVPSSRQPASAKVA